MARLLNSEFDVELADESNLNEFNVLLKGPIGSLYEGGVWKVRVELPDDYPYKSPSIGFVNKIFHPNIDEHSGSVCLDVINQTWSPMFSIYNVFDTFLPQLLSYPNAADPLNGTASNLYHHNRDQYDETVKSYVKQYASAVVPVTTNVDQPHNEVDDADEQLSSSSDDSDFEADVIGTLQAKRRQSSAASQRRPALNTLQMDDLGTLDSDSDMELDL